MFKLSKLLSNLKIKSNNGDILHFKSNGEINFSKNVTKYKIIGDDTVNNMDDMKLFEMRKVSVDNDHLMEIIKISDVKYNVDGEIFTDQKIDGEIFTDQGINKNKVSPVFVIGIIMGSIVLIDIMRKCFH